MLDGGSEDLNVELQGFRMESEGKTHTGKGRVQIKFLYDSVTPARPGLKARATAEKPGLC